MRDQNSKTESKPHVRDKTVAIKAVWYDYFAKIWYEYPRRFKADSASTPSICLRGK